METSLSFDVSGSCTGWCVGNGNTLEDWGKFISKLNRPRSQRLYDFYTWARDLIHEIQPDIILIEKPYLGRNSNVLVSLSKFISALEIAAYSAHEIVIEDEWLIDSKLVKKTLGLRKPKGSTAKKYQANKKQMVLKINNLYGLRLKYNAKKGKTYNDDDIADAIGVFTTWCLLHEDD